jgi:hypothetical protein
MQRRSIEQRVTMLEQQIQELREVPRRLERVEWQTLQLRQDLTAEISATRTDLRTEMHGIRDELRDDISVGVEESQSLARLLHAEAMRAIAAVDTTLRREVVGRLDRLLELQRPRDVSS